jgi:hypothetical protein
MPSRAPLRAEELTEFIGEYSSNELGRPTPSWSGTANFWLIIVVLTTFL